MWGLDKKQRELSEKVEKLNNKFTELEVQIYKLETIVRSLRGFVYKKLHMQLEEEQETAEEPEKTETEDINSVMPNLFGGRAL